jgi:hypothetical protein
MVEAVDKARTNPERAMSLCKYMKSYVRDCNRWRRAHPQKLFGFDCGYKMLLECWPAAAADMADFMQTNGFEPRPYPAHFDYLGLTRQEMVNIIQPAPTLPPDPPPNLWQRIKRWFA